MMRFDGKVVLVTGGSRGIGRACALLFARQGARVVVHYGSNEAAAQRTLSELDGSGHRLVQADIRDAAAVARMVDSVVTQTGRLDILVNNAGIFEEHAIDSVDYAAWQAIVERVLQTNLVGAANATYCAAQHMIRQGGGRIISVSSRTAFRGKPDAPLYAASKAALNAMSQSLAVALAPHHIYIGIVAPGVVATDMATDLAGPLGESIRNQSPIGRVAEPEEVAYTVAFLASEGAEFLTGTIVDVNGASYLRS